MNLVKKNIQEIIVKNLVNEGNHKGYNNLVFPSFKQHFIQIRPSPHIVAPFFVPLPGEELTSIHQVSQSIFSC